MANEQAHRAVIVESDDVFVDAVEDQSVLIEAPSAAVGQARERASFRSGDKPMLDELEEPRKGPVINTTSRKISADEFVKRSIEESASSSRTTLVPSTPASRAESWSDIRRRSDEGLTHVEPRPIVEDEEPGARSNRLPNTPRLEAHQFEQGASLSPQEAAHSERVSESLHLSGKPGFMPEETPLADRRFGADPRSSIERMSPPDHENDHASWLGGISSDAMKMASGIAGGMVMSKYGPAIVDRLSTLFTGAQPDHQPSDASKGLHDRAPADGITAKLRALNGGKEIESYTAADVDIGVIRQKRFGISLPTIKQSRSNDEPRSAAGWARKLLTGNVVVRRSVVESLGRGNGNITIHSNERLDKRTAAEVGATVLRGRSAANTFLNEIKTRQERLSLAEKGGAVDLGNLSHDTKKMLQILNVHEDEIKHLDLIKVAEFARTTKSADRPIGITSKLINDGANGRPSAKRGLDHDARDYYAAARLPLGRASGADTSARAPKSMVKLTLEALSDPNRATTAYLKGCLDSTGLVDARGQNSLFKKSYESTKEYTDNRAIPVVGEHMVPKTISDHMAALSGNVAGHMVEQAMRGNAPNFSEISEMVKKGVARVVSSQLDERTHDRSPHAIGR